MKGKINVAELLKDCPKGMELDCTAYDNVSFDKISADKKATYPIFCYITDEEGNRSSISFTENGCESKRYGAKCIIFPKGKTTWEGFVPPCKFKGGDVLVSESGNIVLLSHIDSENIVHYHCIIPTYGSFRIEENTNVGVGRYYECVLANEQQKQRMYDKIKSSGYKYIQNTNKVEKLIEPTFTDGDIVFYNDTIAIFKEWGDETFFRTYVSKYLWCEDFIDINVPLFGAKVRKEICLATEEEKQKLFNAIKANGYKWNKETKTLEKLVEPIEDKGNISDGYHTFNELYEYRLLYNASMFNELAKQGLYDVHKSKRHSDGTIPFGDKNWFIVQAELPTGQISNHYEMKDWELFDIPEKEKANHYDGHSPQDVAKRLRNFLYLKESMEPKFKVGDYVVKKNGISTPVLITKVGDEFYYSNTEKSVGVFSIQEQDDWVLFKPKFKVGDKIKQFGSPRHYIIKTIESDRYRLNNNQFIRFEDEHIYELVPNKFDINTLKPFESRVLVRDTDYYEWEGALFGRYDGNSFFTIGGTQWNYCIPYEGNEHLLGTINDCEDYYKTWE